MKIYYIRLLKKTLLKKYIFFTLIKINKKHAIFFLSEKSINVIKKYFFEKKVMSVLGYVQNPPIQNQPSQI